MKRTALQDVPRSRSAGLDLTPLLNQEILRVAREEKRTNENSMKQFMAEIADLCDVSVRTLYLYRSGQVKLPGNLVPSLCKRFGSLVLLDALERAAAETQVSVPDQFELAIVVSQTVREDLAVYEEILRAFETDGIQPGELDRMRELEARVHSNVHRLVEIADADCQRRQNAIASEPPAAAGGPTLQRKGSVTAKKSDVRGQTSEVRKQAAR